MDEAPIQAIDEMSFCGVWLNQTAESIPDERM
jgi:hypothetical protein